MLFHCSLHTPLPTPCTHCKRGVAASLVDLHSVPSDLVCILGRLTPLQTDGKLSHFHNTDRAGLAWDVHWNTVVSPPHQLMSEYLTYIKLKLTRPYVWFTITLH